MSEKKYYWLKLKSDFFEDDTIQFIEEQPNGIAYSNFYLKLCLKSLKNDGKLVRNVGETLIPYDIKSLAKLTGVGFDIVRSAMELFLKLGIVQQLDSGELYISQLSLMIGSESANREAIKKRNYRNKQKLLATSTEISAEGQDSGQQGGQQGDKMSDRDRDRERDRVRDRDRELYAPSLESSPPVITLPTNKTNIEYPVKQEFIDEMQSLYEGVNVMRELKAMRAWLLNNPKNRKTYNGMTKFINGWLSREQNRAPKQEETWEERMAKAMKQLEEEE